MQVTDPEGNPVGLPHIYDDKDIGAALIFTFGIDRAQAKHALEILAVNPETAYDLSIIEETDNSQTIVWTARLTKYKGPSYA